MSRKLLLLDWQNLATTRNHKLISVTNTETIAKGNLNLLCNICNSKFTISAKSYRNCKNGCPTCKKKAISSFWLGKKRTNDKLFNIDKTVTTRKHKLKNPNPKYNSINSKEDIINFLTSDPNKYNLFILEKFQNQSLNNEKKNETVTYEKHHIIPIHAGGPDKPFNLIRLTTQDHILAHMLRYEVYKELGDKLFLNFKSEESISPEKAKKNRIAASHEAQKQNKSGFFSSEQQAKHGKKGGKND